MYRKEINDQNPLRILERSTKGGLGPGNLGVVMARAGVGKTAFLVQIGLDEAMRERSVLHIALGQDLEHVHSWYDALFYDFSEATKLDAREQVRALMTKHRLIQAYADADLSHERLDELVRLFADSLHFEPKAILIDGFDWEKGKVLERAAKLSGFKSTAKRLGAELWMTARTHREGTPAHPTRMIAPCIAYEELIDVAVFLEPEGTHVTVCLLKDHDSPKIEDTHLQLHIDTMRLATDDVSDNGNLPSTTFFHPAIGRGQRQRSCVRRGRGTLGRCRDPLLLPGSGDRSETRRRRADRGGARARRSERSLYQSPAPPVLPQDRHVPATAEIDLASSRHGR